MNSWFVALLGRRRQAARGQHGAGLVEVLIATAVAVPLTLAGAMGLLTSLRAADQAAHRQELSVALTNATESLRASRYLACGTAEEYQKSYASTERPTVDGPFRAQAQLSPAAIELVRYWNDERQAYVERCERDGGAQQLVVTVISDRLGTMTGSVVLTDPRGRSGSDR